MGGPADYLDTVEKQVRWVRNVAGQTIKSMKGQPGVIVLDHNDGRKRIRIGQASSTETREETGGN